MYRSSNYNSTTFKASIDVGLFLSSDACNQLKQPEILLRAPGGFAKGPPRTREEVLSAQARIYSANSEV